MSTGEYEFDIDLIKKQVGEILSYSQGFNFYNNIYSLNGIDAIIERWLKAKEYFIRHMNGHLIWESPTPVSFEIDDNAKNIRVSNFITWIENFYENWDLTSFLRKVSVEEFYNNKTTRDYYVNDDIKISENSKIVKAFKFFIKDEDSLKEIQSEASRIIQENVISGKLCFSVHPLDFLSASENSYNWRSCHSLDGEYRSGNMNYMMDDSTVICYLKGEKEFSLPHFPPEITWNSKKWRVWFFFSNDKTMLFAGRQYPFETKQGINIIKDKVLPLLRMDFWSDFSRDKICSREDSFSQNIFHFSKLIPVGKEAIPLKRLVRDGENTYHYNDILRSHFYDPVYAYRLKAKNDWFSDDASGTTGYSTRFRIGEACPCPICGQSIIDYSEVMACTSCCRKYDLFDTCDYQECEVCGTMIYIEDLISLDLSGTYICRDCYERETHTCQSCGVTDLPEYVRHRQEDPRCLCDSCFHRVIDATRITYKGEIE